MKLFGFVLLVCPLMAQVEIAGIPASDPVPSSLIPPSSLSSPSATETPFSTPRPAASAAYLTVPPEKDGKKLYRWSLAAVAAGNAADTFSSWHHPEANLFLANPGTNFDGRSVALKSAFIGASFLIEHWALKHNTGLYRPLAWLNFAIGGALGGVAAHNMSQH
jgi:hypothetical protein